MMADDGQWYNGDEMAMKWWNSCARGFTRIASETCDDVVELMREGHTRIASETCEEVVELVVQG